MTTTRMLHAYETDNGPGGISWEVTVDGTHLSLATLEDVRDAAMTALRRPDGSIYGMRRRPIAVYTLADWEAGIARGADPGELVHPSYILDPDPTRCPHGARWTTCGHEHPGKERAR
jgi:hypothetical protein